MRPGDRRNRAALLREARRSYRQSRIVEVADKRVVANPEQAVRLLDGVRQQGRTGRHLVVFFGLMYYSALRPAEAAALGQW